MRHDVSPVPAYNVSRGWHGLDDSWMSRGACRDVADPSIFFADDGRKLSDKLNVAEAKRVCIEQCEFRLACREYALEADLHDGVWGGTTGDERMEIRRHRRQQARRAV